MDLHALGSTEIRHWILPWTALMTAGGIMNPILKWQTHGNELFRVLLIIVNRSRGMAKFISTKLIKFFISLFARPQ